MMTEGAAAEMLLRLPNTVFGTLCLCRGVLKQTPNMCGVLRRSSIFHRVDGAHVQVVTLPTMRAIVFVPCLTLKEVVAYCHAVVRVRSLT